MKPPHEPEDLLPSAEPEELDRHTCRTRFLDAVSAGLAEAEAGRTISDQELGKLLDDEFGNRAASGYEIE
jgi:predicted transcriptional regulator